MTVDARPVVLFDVDGTLIRTEGASPHSRAFRAAFQNIYGAECHFSRDMHGMTDRQIFVTLALDMGLGNGLGRDLAMDACRLMVQLYQEPAESDGRYVIIPGVRPTLERLQRLGAVLGLVTGNVPEIARHKLDSVGLADFFAFGAFGTEAEDRTSLPPIAIVRAEAAIGGPVDRRRVVVVGDTPRDVACARDNGLRAVAVATGHVPLEELLATGAELVLPNLLDAEPLLRLLEP